MNVRSHDSSAQNSPKAFHLIQHESQKPYPERHLPIWTSPQFSPPLPIFPLWPHLLLFSYSLYSSHRWAPWCSSNKILELKVCFQPKELSTSTKYMLPSELKCLLQVFTQTSHSKEMSFMIMLFKAIKSPITPITPITPIPLFCFIFFIVSITLYSTLHILLISFIIWYKCTIDRVGLITVGISSSMAGMAGMAEGTEGTHRNNYDSPWNI